MKGVIFDLHEQVVVDELGEPIWAQIVAGAGGRTDHAPDGTYSHEEFLSLVRESSIALSRSPDETLIWFGRRSIALLAERYPELFRPHSSTIGFVLTLNDVVHPKVSEDFPGAVVPDFEFDRVAEDTLIMAYSSYRDLCPFAQGLVEGTADHYDEVTHMEHFHCQRKGDPRCAIVLRTSPSS